MAEKKKNPQVKEGNAAEVISKINKWRRKSADFDAKLAGDKYLALKKEEENLVKKQSALSKKKGRTWEDLKEAKDIEIKLKQLRAEMKKAWDKRIAAVRKAVQLRGVEGQVKEDTKKANVAKKVVKSVANKQTRKAKPKEEFHVPEEVQKKAEELGAQYVTLRDSKGNNIFVFEKDGKHAGVMTQKAGKDISVLLENKSEEMNGLIHDAIVANRKPRTSDFGNTMDLMAKQYGKDMQAEAMSQIKAVPIVSHEDKAPEIKNVELKIKPTVTLVPHIKRNGKPSKRNFDIQLMDADGKVFTLTKKMVKDAVKQKGNDVASHDDMAESSWDNYLKAAKEGNLSAETVASFFKGQTSLNIENASTNPKLKGAELEEAKIKGSPTAKIPNSVLMQEIKNQRS